MNFKSKLFFNRKVNYKLASPLIKNLLSWLFNIVKFKRTLMGLGVTLFFLVTLNLVITKTQNTFLNHLFEPRKPASLTAQRVLSTSPLAESERLSKEFKKEIKTEDYIPMSLDPIKDKNKVFIKVADRTLTTFFNTEGFKKSPLGSTAQQVQDNLKTEVVIKSNQKINHRLTTEILAFEGKAKMSYRGFFNLDLTTNAFGETQFKIYENIFDNLEGSVFLEQIQDEQERLSQVGLRLPW